MTDPSQPPPVEPGAGDDRPASAPAAAPIGPPIAPPTYWATPAAPAAGPAPGYVYVGFWRRFLATLIDGVLFTFLYFILFAIFVSRIDVGTLHVFTDINRLTGKPVASDAEIIAATRQLMGGFVGLFGLVFLAHLLYHVIFWSWRGGTLGQLVLGIQVRRESDGRRIGLGRSVLRYVGWLISAWVLYIGLIWAAFDRRKQGWHDKIAGTLVIRRAD
jgi:uncharacterized RDD family membrane protein YckC